MKDCKCGKVHKEPLTRVILENGAVDRLKDLLLECKAKKVFIIADKNTERVAGDKVYAILDEITVAYKRCVFAEEKVVPNEMFVGRAVMSYDQSCDLVLAIGSGVINDISKIVSKIADKPYYIIATAPSMDGYVSATSSMEVDGVKVSLPSKCADVIIGDIDVLKNAPMQMLQAGLGDMLAKYISVAEWRIANEILGEYYCEDIAEQVRVALRKCIDQADLLLQRDENAVKAVFEGLVLCGKAMAMAECSRPASGVEHYFSHVWDMRGLEFTLPTNLHGIQCAVATYIVSGLYEKVLTLTPDKERALSYVQAFDYSNWAKQLKSFLGTSADAMITLEEKEKKYSVEAHKARLQVIIEKWDKICTIIRQEIPTQKQIEKLLQTIGLPTTPKEIGIDCDLALTLKATKDIRDKYVLSRLLWDIGEIETII